ncbi:YggS family pyridoxal phosphate-dependent enzyme [Xylophilus sp.]|uniref:YggS family pyridoxal phosphate-dependent enzyme n=1 Tax=Xylophilus sp. TaxID=2653893 RepID=UPI0013B9DF93|nr:YggS family pyridoxal phosphate-dependent enzyme [Xylophilus sp.]KAF1048915.1 MAG: Pyridoxal phosphate homeostasis protein [Xylophilus sp.]
MTIARQLDTVRGRIAAACAAAGRDPQSVRLLAVSKTFGAEAVAEAAAAGQTAFGENYVQEAAAKIDALAHLPLQWHCIGPLQANKTRAAAERFAWVHTVDRLRIAERLAAQRPAGLPPLSVCIQVNIDGGPSKSGVAPDEAPALARAVALLPRLALRGLMAVPEPAEGFDAQLAVHRQVRALFEAIRAEGGPGMERFDTLSLGMSGDLEAAIHAGSTLVRVGSAIFGNRNYAA